MSEFDAVSRAYLVAGLSLERHLEGYVDSYHGPDELRLEADATGSVDALDRLDMEINKLDAGPRRTFLLSQSRAMRAVERMSRGETAGYAQQVEDCFDIRPEWVEESVFESAHYALDQLLPGSGDVAQRRQSYRKAFELDHERVMPLAETITSELRARTAELVALPEGEQVDIRLVSGQPWSGYNWYLGNVSSRIELNTDQPVRLNDLPGLLAHEAYPGHHTEHSLREQRQVREQGFGEYAIALLISPQAVVSEGIATTAFDVVVPPDEQVAWLEEHVYRPAGMAVDIEADLAIAQAGKALAAVRGNVALMLNERDGSIDDAVAYMVRYEFRSEEEARRSVDFLVHPLFRTYIYTYTAGYDLVSTFLASGASHAEGFRRLLTEHWTPSLLRGSGNGGTSDAERLPF